MDFINRESLIYKYNVLQEYVRRINFYLKSLAKLKDNLYLVFKSKLLNLLDKELQDHILNIEKMSYK